MATSLSKSIGASAPLLFTFYSNEKSNKPFTIDWRVEIHAREFHHVAIESLVNGMAVGKTTLLLNVQHKT